MMNQTRIQCGKCEKLDARELELRVGIRYVTKENSGVKPGSEDPVIGMAVREKYP